MFTVQDVVHPLGLVINLWALHSALTALGKLQLEAVRFPNNAHLEPVTAVGLVASSDSCGCNFGVVGVVVSQTPG